MSVERNGQTVVDAIYRQEGDGTYTDLGVRNTDEKVWKERVEQGIKDRDDICCHEDSYPVVRKMIQDAVAKGTLEDQMFAYQQLVMMDTAHRYTPKGK